MTDPTDREATAAAPHVASSYQVALPEPFKLSKPEQWPKWIRRFEHFRSASGLSMKEGKIQVDTLLYAMGSDADDVMLSFHLTEDDASDYAKVKEKFDNHFVKKRNIIYERARFNTRRQEKDESVDTFVTALHNLAQYCNFKDLHDEMIRDRLVVGLRDAKLSERLQLDADLTLETALTKARQSETVHKQQVFLRGKEEELPISNVNQGKTKSPCAGGKCSRCGITPPHPCQNCPAREAKCKACGKMGHYKRVCRSSGKVHGVCEEFLGAVSGCSKKKWDITVHVSGTSVKFKIDTGAEVTVISDDTHKAIGSPPLEQPDRILRGPSNCKLPVMGWFVADMQTERKKCRHRVYVVKKLHVPLLGRPAIESLEILARVGNVTSGKTPKDKFPKLFQGLGKLEGDYHITLKPGSTPYSLNTPRRVPIPLMKSVQAELDRMEKQGVIAKVTEPTEWCSGMVVVPKKGGRVRICVDLTRLNENVCRERHILPAVEQTLAQLVGAKVFSKLDANSGFWQISLSPQSQHLTTFITPFGRYCFRRLPFGITSAPEHFQRRISEILVNLDGVFCLMDDVLIYGETQQQHDERLDKVLQRLQESGLTLNADKCQFACSQLPFLGQILTQEGVKADPDKVTAIQKVPAPQNVGDVRRFLGMVNQMGKFTPNLAERTKPLRDLLQKDSDWTWGPPQQSSFEDLKKLLISSPVLALYDPSFETTVSADASSFGLGAVLLQKQPSGDLKPVAYVSRSMTPTEQRYAQIEKEALAFTWACERFSTYLIGLRFHIETDHKPLVPLFSTKHLDELPIRVQRFRLRMMRYDFSISHVAGKQLVTADALSRAPSEEWSRSDHELQQDTGVYVQQVVQTLPATDQRLEQIRQSQEADPVCQQLVQLTSTGWPEGKSLSGEIRPYYTVRSELTVAEGILMRGSRIVIPHSLRQDILQCIHTGHQGISKCRDKARQSVWWPGLAKELETLVKNCEICCKHQAPAVQPLIPSSLPDLPWQRVGTDLFEYKQKPYLLIVDYYSRFIEIALLHDTSSATVIRHTKSIFARHGIPEVVISDNGPQFHAECYKQFAEDYSFKHVTSSPYYPQGNGEAERAVGTIKRLLEKEEDPYLALLAYRSTPLQNGFSPAELLMSRKLRASVPITRESLKPSVPDYDQLKARDKKAKDRQKSDHDKRHRAKDTPLKSGDRVWMPDRESEARVEQEIAPRSFELITSDGVTLRRNQSSLRRLPDKSQEEPLPEPAPVQPPEQSSGAQEPEHQEPDSLPAAETTSTEPLQQTGEPPTRTSSRVRKLRDRWEPNWTSQRQNPNRS